MAPENLLKIAIEEATLETEKNGLSDYGYHGFTVGYIKGFKEGFEEGLRAQENISEKKDDTL